MIMQSFASVVEEVGLPSQVVGDVALFPSVARARYSPQVGVSIAEVEAAAYARGFHEAEGLVSQHMAAVTEASRRQVQEAIDAETARLRDGEGASLAWKLTDGFVQLEASIIGRVRAVLQGLLEDELVERALNELGRILQKAIAANGAMELTISASDELVEAIRQQLPPDWTRVVFVAGEGPDIRVVSRDIEVSVDLETWRRQIAIGTL